MGGTSRDYYTENTLREALNAVEQHGSLRKGAAALEISCTEIQRRVQEARKRCMVSAGEKTESVRGMNGTRPILPGFVIKQTSAQLDADGQVEKEWVQQKPEPGPEFSVPDGHIVKGVSALVDGDGKTLAKWIKTKEGVDPVRVVEMLKEAFANFAPSAPARPLPDLAYENLLTFIPIADMHMGMSSWGKETGESWDLKIAVETYHRSFDDLLRRCSPTRRAMLLFGGDQMHSDNNDNMTARSKNVLQVDGRYNKVLLTTCELAVWKVERLLTMHEAVEVRILPGNHDEHASAAVAFFLLAYFRNEPRVTVDISPSPFWFKRFGKVLLGATHGHMAKAKDLLPIMASYVSEDWGLTTYRYGHSFHLHQTAIVEALGGTVETHRTLVTSDSWHAGMGYRSGRSLQAIFYDPEEGEVGRSGMNLRRQTIRASTFEGVA